MAEAKIEETVCEDMISALPEDLLVNILLLVPIKDAVATIILSKRWRSIWMMLPRLEYKENRDGHDCSFYDDDNGDNDKSKRSIWWFFDKSLELHKAPVIETSLLIKLGPGCPSDADVGKWLTKGVDRCVAVLKFKLCWSTGPTRLPKSLYSCETLEELTLSLTRFLWISLLLLASHPVSLLNFSMWYIKTRLLLLGSYRAALIDFQIADFSRNSWSIENMPCLESAYIHVKSFPDIEKSKTSISKVLSLVLFMTDEVEYTFSPEDRIPLSWNQPSSIPGCTSSHLEIFECREYGDCRDEEEEFLTYILANSKCLKTVTISVRPSFDPEKKELIIEELRNIPRVSTTSQLLFK